METEFKEEEKHAEESHETSIASKIIKYTRKLNRLMK